MPPTASATNQRIDARRLWDSLLDMADHRRHARRVACGAWR